MESYLNLVDRILTEGKEKSDRTGIGNLAIFGIELKHDMSQGFPLLTTKKMYTKSIFVELEGFIKGITDKKWYQDKNCHIWDDWCNPQIVPYAHDLETKRKMFEERDLGPIYGFQWRHFGAKYDGYNRDYNGEGIDQLSNIVKTLKTNPMDRRMVVSAWNPLDLDKMALPPCHYSFEVSIINNKLNLKWNQRSVDTMLGLPFNIASYATILHLLAKEAGFKEGTLIAHLGDTHIYKNQVENAKLQLTRKPYPLPEIEITNFSSIFNWQHNQIKTNNYQCHPKIEFQIAV
ncbi:MAG: thymidylate synthase [Nanoarchaeota archaeon]